MHPTQLITFNVLFFLSIFRPAGLSEETSLPVGPLAVIVATVIFLGKVHSPSQFRVFFQRFKTPLLLIAAYTALCLLSLLYNHSRYEDIGEFLRWGLVFIIGQSFLPLCIFLFLLSDKKGQAWDGTTRTALLVTGLNLALIPISVLVQTYFPDIAPALQTYFVGGDIPRNGPIRGVLATSTDLGAISGILCLTATALAARGARDSLKKSLFFSLFSIIFAFAGILSESRNFVLFIGVACITVLFASFWKYRKGLLIATMPALVTLVYVSAYLMPPRLAYKMGRFIPHFANVHSGADTSIVDLLPNLSFGSLGPRGPLWQSALRVIAENPLIGVSNGGFRLDDGCECQLGNTHNLLMQSAIDAGVLGTLVVAVLIGYVIKGSLRNKWLLALILSTTATLMVDNFTDHSYAWIVIVSFAGVFLHQRNWHKSA